ncbi:copper resistance CopC family protein [Arthrobacter sp. 35/47]|uniref:copper resistance CopC family protein n=1 Tax=Arthrobacter sp. 35/47 TaxID=269454 RepID=UPI0004AF7517|nr:copper resistance CopC family protein [Arthrobacter sp. 35/47]
MHTPDPATTTLARRPRTQRLRRALLGVFAALMIGSIGAPAATAHDSLIGTAPEEGQVIATAPEAITITLSETPLESSGLELSRIQITGPDGTPVEAVPVTLEENVMSAPAAIDAPGVYSVAWRTVSSDGHPIEGVFEFTYEPASTTPAEDPSTAAPSAQATESEEPSVAPETVAPTSSPADPVAEPASEEAASSGGVNWLLPIVIAVIVIGGAAAFMMGHRQAVKADARQDGTEG